MIIGPIVISIVSYVNTGNLKTYFKQLDWWAYIAFGSFTLAWLIFNLYKRRQRTISSKNQKTLSPIFFIPSGGYVDIGKYNYKGLEWIIRHPRLSTYEEVTNSNMWKYIEPNSVHVSMNARCPNCGTELEERHLFFGSIKLTCPREDFKIKTNLSMYEMSDKVEKLVKRDIEIKKQSN